MIDWVAQHAGMIGLLFFFIVFTFISVWVFRPGSRQFYQAQANIPLSEDNHD